MVDSAVYALSESRPGLAQAFFRLERDLLRPRVSVRGVSPAIFCFALRSVRAGKWPWPGFGQQPGQMLIGCVSQTKSFKEREVGIAGQHAADWTDR